MLGRRLSVKATWSWEKRVWARRLKRGKEGLEESGRQIENKSRKSESREIAV